MRRNEEIYKNIFQSGTEQEGNIMLMIRDMEAGIIFGTMIMMTMMIGTTKIGIMTTGMMRMTSSWMIIGQWRVLVPGS